MGTWCFSADLPAFVALEVVVWSDDQLAMDRARGRVAALQGRAVTDNPHRLSGDNARYMWWNLGFRDARIPDPRCRCGGTGRLALGEGYTVDDLCNDPLARRVPVGHRIAIQTGTTAFFAEVTARMTCRATCARDERGSAGHGPSDVERRGGGARIGTRPAERDPPRGPRPDAGGGRRRGAPRANDAADDRHNLERPGGARNPAARSERRRRAAWWRLFRHGPRRSSRHSPRRGRHGAPGHGGGHIAAHRPGAHRGSRAIAGTGLRGPA